MRGLALALLLASSAAASEFLENLRRADAREARDPERAEFASRAIRAWKPAEGPRLLAHAHRRRAEARLELFEHAAAIEDLSRAVELDPGDHLAWLLRGKARLEQGKPREAEKDLAEYASRAPEDPEGWLALAEARFSGGRSEKSVVDAAARAASLAPGDPRSALWRARAVFAAGRHHEALEAVDLSVSQAKGRLPEALLARARVKARLGDPRGAEADAGDSLPAFRRRLEEAARSGRPDKAREAPRAGLAAAHHERGGLRETLGRPADALEDYDEACALGHQQACRKAETLRPTEAPAAAAPPKPRKRRLRAPKSDAGERIYAN